jgi:hypothetical protein
MTEGWSQNKQIVLGTIGVGIAAAIGLIAYKKIWSDKSAGCH